MEVEAEGWSDRAKRASECVLAPHIYTARCLANSRLRNFRPLFLQLSRILVLADGMSCFALWALLEAGFGRGALDTAPTALKIGYALTSFGFLLYFLPQSVKSLKAAVSSANETMHIYLRVFLAVSGLVLLGVIIMSSPESTSLPRVVQ